MTKAIITFTADGSGHCLYSEAINLQALGKLTCRRASGIDFDAATQKWQVRIVGSQEVVFAAASRQACLDWEQANLQPL